MSNLCIIKTHRNKKFATIDLTASEDKKLSWKAKGIHTYLISRPDGWEVYLAELEKRSTDGKDGLRAGLVELHKAGYFDWHQKNENGKFEKTQYDLYESPNAKVMKKATTKLSKKREKNVPLTENPGAVPLTALPEAEKTEAVDDGKEKKIELSKEKTIFEPLTAFPVSGKSAPNIYHINNSINNNQCIEAPKDSAPIPALSGKIKYAEFVSMTDTEYKKLLEKYGDEFTKRLIEKLDNWKGVAPKKRKYESDYRAILTWVVDAVNEKLSKEKIRNGQVQRNAGTQRSFGNGNAGHGESKGRIFQPGEVGEYGGSGKKDLRKLIEQKRQQSETVS